MKQQKQAEWDPGLEYLDPTPVAIPVGAQRPESLAETIRRLVRNDLSINAAQAGLETFEESIDFDIDDPEEAEHISMYEQAADMHEELLEGQNVDREMRSRLSNRSEREDIPERTRSGRPRSGDSRNGADRGSDEGSDRGVEVQGDSGTRSRETRVRGKGRGRSPADGKDTAGQYDED